MIFVKDFNVSRKRERVIWGIGVPDNQEDLIYVWFDALNSYLTSAQRLNFLEEKAPHFEKVQDFSLLNVVGKDILKFHSSMWPLMINSLGLDIHQSIICHNHWVKDNVSQFS